MSARPMFRWSGLLGILLLGFPLLLRAQEKVTATNPYGNGLGLTFQLTNSGFGLGGYYRRLLAGHTSGVLELSLGAGKDEKEQKFFTIFGQTIVPNKKNYLLIIPLQAGIQHRLFAESIRENFRPFLQLTAGPSLGWVSPYFEDANGNGTREPNEKIYDSLGALFRGEGRLGVGGTLALGAYFGFSKRSTQGIRLGYTFTYFFRAVALMEEHVRPPVHFLGTPFIGLIFGRVK